MQIKLKNIIYKNTNGYTLNVLEQFLLECEKWKCKKTKQTGK